MRVYDTFSKRRKKELSEGQPDVYEYDRVPEAFRNQLIHILTDAIGELPNYTRGQTTDDQIWELIHDILSREHGLLSLCPQLSHLTFRQQVTQYLLKASPYNALDVVEVSIRIVEDVVPKYEKRGRLSPEISPEDAINELNIRFQEHGMGYEYENGKLIRIDSKFIHAAAVKPALALLGDDAFSGPNEEFLQAHELYREGKHKDAIVNALKAFESTMKVIIDARGWSHAPTATARDLLNVILSNHLIPTYLQDHFSGLRKTLEAGLPTVRNKTSGHGQGVDPVDVPEYMAAYALHLTATNIVMLVEAHKATS